MHAYSLDTHEGVMLMCLAEALLRVPDAETQERLIRDKIGDVDWQRRVASSESFLINASAFGLMLSGRVMRWDIVAATVAICVTLTLAVGFAGTWRILGQKAAPYLRNE